MPDNAPGEPVFCSVYFLYYRKNSANCEVDAMGFLEDVFNIIGKVTSVVMYAAGTIVGIAAAGVVQFAEVAFEKYDEFREKNRSVNLALANKPIHNTTKDLNDEILEIEQKKYRDRTLNHYDNQRLNSLYSQRDNLKGEVRKNNELLMIEKMKNGQGVYDNIHINNVNTHILQFHVGQTVFGKRCPQCEKPMVLQWKQGMQTVSMSDFFWGCIGFYDGTRHNEPFRQSDMDLFTRVDRPEFEISSQALSNMILLPGPKSNITKRMSDIKQEKTDVYLCPVHNEPMILREKKNAQGLLDQYFFGCPRWLPNGKGCGQLVKLKSAGQLASALEAFYSRGIL